MRQTILPIILIISSIGYSQDNILKLDFIPKNIDSVQFSIWDVHNKEMSTLDQEEKEYANELKRVILSKKDQNYKSQNHTTIQESYFNTIT